MGGGGEDVCHKSITSHACDFDFVCCCFVAWCFTNRDTTRVRCMSCMGRRPHPASTGARRSKAFNQTHEPIRARSTPPSWRWPCTPASRGRCCAAWSTRVGGRGWLMDAAHGGGRHKIDRSLPLLPNKAFVGLMVAAHYPEAGAAAGLLAEPCFGGVTCEFVRNRSRECALVS